MSDLKYLPLVVEECGEVIQAAMKLQRFGADHKYRTGSHQGKTNTEALANEIGDLLEVIARLQLPPELIEAGQKHKCKRLKLYSPHIWYPGIEDRQPGLSEEEE